jgi:molybdopterin molybdotransferase
MTRFLKVKTAEEVLEIVATFQPLDAESVELGQALGRVPAESVSAREPVPHFPRATMDGYAVAARDTFGASESLPAILEIGGEVRMGREFTGKALPGHAIAIPTGGMLPAGSDAVVMVEYSHTLDERTIEITKPVAPGDNVLGIGEDIKAGDELSPVGRRLRPQDIGAMAALGIAEVSVYRRPKVAILSTGDEIVPVETARLQPGKVRDINIFTVAAQVMEAGGLVGLTQIIPDNMEDLVAACRGAFIDHDVVLLSGGSSVGARDFTVGILGKFEDAELLVHGVAIRPGKPTILARIGKKIFWGLPGQPVSAMMICRAFVQPSLALLQGVKQQGAIGAGGVAHSAILKRRLPSVHGRTDYVPLTLSIENGILSADPIFGKSAMISTISRSDGYVVIPEHDEGLERGTEVTVHMFQCEMYE